MESKNSTSFKVIDQDKMQEEKSDINFSPSQNPNLILQDLDLDKSKIMDEFPKKQKIFEDNKEQWKSFIEMMASKWGNSNDELERIRKLRSDVKVHIDFFLKFQISLKNYESSLLLNKQYDEYQKLFTQIKLIREKIENDSSQIKLKKNFNDFVDKLYLDIEEYEKKLYNFKLNNTKIEEELMHFDNKFKEITEMIDQFRAMIKKEKKLKRCENIRREKLNQRIQNLLKVIKMVEIDEIGDRNLEFEMDIQEELGYTAKSFKSNKNGKTNFYIHLLENKTGEKIQEIMIKEFENEIFPRCKWNNAKEIKDLKLAVYIYGQTFGFILEMDENSKKLKENYQKFEIGNSNNWQMLFSEKYAIINHDKNGITVFDSKTLQKIENVQGSNAVLVGLFYDDDNYIYSDNSNRIFNYNLKTKTQQIVNGNHPHGYCIRSMNISKESNTLFLGDDIGNIYTSKLNLGNRKFASIRKSISTGVSSYIYRMEFISIDKLMIAIKGQKNLRIVDIKSGKIEEKEIIKENQLDIYDFKFDEKNGVIVVLACDKKYEKSKSQIHFLSE